MEIYVRVLVRSNIERRPQAGIYRNCLLKLETVQLHLKFDMKW